MITSQNRRSSFGDFVFYSISIALASGLYLDGKQFSDIDYKIELLNLKPRDRVVLDCYMAGMNCVEIAQFLDIDRVTVWRRRQRAQVKYKTLFHSI